MRLESPWALLLLLLIPLLLWWQWRRSRQRGSIRFSATDEAVQAGRSIRQLLAFTPTLIRVIAFVLLVVAIARPQKGSEQIQEVSEGIAIEMVVDRSSSMGAEMRFQGQRLNRLEVVKRVFHDFVMGAGDLKGRENDLIGMITFARFADTICPLTLGHDLLPTYLQTVQLAAQDRDRNGVPYEDGTAIGDALALAAARLETAEETFARQSSNRSDSYKIQSKIIILLTDGRQTAGERHPLEGAALAKEWGIKIYTIAVGGSGDRAVGGGSIIDQFMRMGRHAEVDVETLQAIADETGGRFYAAEDAQALTQIYEEIDKLERTEIETIRFTNYEERFLPFALAAMLLLVLEMILNHTIFRRIP
ncbi:MAG: VWA domain-containing protein [Verrucomicrobiota bacterium]